MKHLRKAAPVVVSVLLYSLAFPPADLSLLVFVALIPWFSSLKTLSPKQGFRSGLLFGALFWMFQMSWLPPFVTRWTGSLALGLTPWVLCPLIGMFYFGLVGWLVSWCLGSGRDWLVPVVWGGVEVIRTYMVLLAFPWGLLASPLWITPMIIQHATLGTIAFVSAWVVLGNQLILRGLQADWSIRTKQMIAIFFGFAALSVARYVAKPGGEPQVITLGQPGVDLAYSPPDVRDRQISEAANTLMKGAIAQESALLVLPEGLASGGDGNMPSNPFGPRPAVPLIFGGQRLVEGSYPPVRHQTAFAYDGEWKYADKTRLVIFGEYVPFRNFLPFLDAFALPNGDLAPGKATSALTVNRIRVGPVLCFEALFPNVALAQQVNGSRLLTVMSLDDWYMGTIAPAQLRSGAIWRAVECGLPVARVGSLGYTLGIDARGNILAEAPLGRTFPLRVEMSLPESGDGFRYRHIVEWSMAAGMGLVALAAVRSGRTGHRPEAS